MKPNELIYGLALSKIPGVGAKLGKQLIAYCGGVEGVFRESKRILLRVPNIGEQLAEEIKSADPHALAEPDLQYCEQNNIKVTFCLDEDYPIRFKHIADGPLLIYSKGCLLYTSPSPRD